jgi:hypothetical protein
MTASIQTYFAGNDETSIPDVGRHGIRHRHESPSIGGKGLRECSNATWGTDSKVLRSRGMVYGIVYAIHQTEPFRAIV